MKIKIIVIMVIIIFLISSIGTGAITETNNKIRNILSADENNNSCNCNYYDEYYEITSSNNWDYYCNHENSSNRNMESWICDNPDGGDKHNPCWCHIGIHTYFIGKDGIYNFSNIEGETRHTEMCGLGNPGTGDMSICSHFGTWPIDGEPWNPDSWRWYLETSIDGIHWELVCKYPFDKIKRTTPFGPTSIPDREFRFIRFRMCTDRRGIGLAGYMDRSTFNINELKLQNIENEGLEIIQIHGNVKTHKYRLMQISTMLVQISYDGTADWNTIHEFPIQNNQLTSFNLNLNNSTLSRFIRLIPKSGQWNGMPAIPSFIDLSNITIIHSEGTKELSCEQDTMECTLSPIHPCWSGGKGYHYNDYNDCENFMMSGSFQHTYPLLSTKVNSTPPNKPHKPNGPTDGKVDEKYTYTTSTTDHDEHQIYYMFDWDSDDKHLLTPWIGPYDSGETAKTSFKWSQKDIYSIRVKAKDRYGYKSEWSEPLTFNANRVKNRLLNPQIKLNQLIKIFINKFQLFSLI